MRSAMRRKWWHVRRMATSAGGDPARCAKMVWRVSFGSWGPGLARVVGVRGASRCMVGEMVRSLRGAEDGCERLGQGSCRTDSSGARTRNTKGVSWKSNGERRTDGHSAHPGLSQLSRTCGTAVLRDCGSAGVRREMAGKEDWLAGGSKTFGRARDLDCIAENYRAGRAGRFPREEGYINA